MAALGPVLFAIVFFAFAGCGKPAFSQTQKQADPLQVFLQAYITQAGLPGAVVGIAYQDGSSRFAAAGLSHVAPSRKMRGAERFYIGSLTKMMTSVVILQLASEQRLKLSDHPARWLPPEYAQSIANVKQATLIDLLHNSSGIPDYLDGDFFFELVGREPRHGWRNAELLPLIADRDPVFSPGSEYANSNSNYILLGYIIEQIEQASIEEVFEKRIFTPLEMDATSFGSFPRDADLARGYDDGDGDGNLEDVTGYDVGDHLADGGVVSTARDMLAFIRGLFVDGTLLGPQAIERMTTDTMFAGNGAYGYGVMVGESDWGPVWGHDGTYFGYSAEISWFPKQKTAIVFLTNGRPLNDVSPFTQQILPAIFGNPLQ
ncbi:serine hydrolase [Thalassospira sp. MCCC 1A01428]|uniref:serine hydrolase domain-containing protein n=1 Tax=Thalassospira sp. MCCC 1A01428 TaxID=1470575 RepID=UPI000A1F783E|nr:serine hydrolase domain-containing protein [Thalassospira sp. MCCC 1A01428]